MNFDDLERIAGNSDALVYVRDSSGRYVYVNEGFARDTGWDLEYVKGKTNRELYGEQAASWETADGLANGDGKFVVTEETRLLPNTTNEYERFVSTKLPIEIDGETYLAGISVKITNDQAAEHEKYLANLRARFIQAMRRR